jgi:hypothetical protein
MKMLTIADRILIASLAILTLFSYSIASGGKQGEEIRVEADGRVVGAYSLKSERVLEIKGVLGKSRIAVKGGRASFLSSPCKNKVCIHQGEVGKSGQMAACLPNRVVVRVLGGSGDYDAVTR